MDPFEIIARYQKTPPVNLNGIAEELGMHVTEIDMPSDIAGKIIRDGRSPSGYSIYLNAKQHRNRRRFTLAHEIAHFVLHRDLIESGLTDDTMYRSSLSNYYEVQANRLAADILMPVGQVRNYRDQLDAGQLAEKFNVSEAAMKIRLDGLGK